ncbi:cagE, TrbE, VirB, component of type IV transporter system family protein (plasmid) [Yersinia pseudotuberculosis IP 32953]|uniref:TriC protein n=1 Tax=Yersinia pseudotuberculosis serotype I (strain IP32953) TaxID=273123 RepID=Q663E8_YERPS|nr:VirB3 family type IV secretion system protein [Yersinia pseudotuberculosis]AJJ53072.1 cagE, TrbE, VirB, component of type IV transporter system family protein [Yersinia pseudotuberculosis IP 32953]CAF25448.1 TriC protein [Yersinia pseudotuberculosis IP 32953]
MTTIFKALTRPAMILGVPIIPLIIAMSGISLAAVYTTTKFFFLIPVAWWYMRHLARKDAHIFSLMGLKIRTKGNGKTNQHFDSTAWLANDYGDVDITEFLNAMRLNERVTLTDKIPYSSHVHEYIIKGKNSDLMASWEVGGSVFEFETDEQKNMKSAQLNTLIKSFEGEPVTFYIHNSRENYHDSFQQNSGNAFADEVAKRYYEGMEGDAFYRNRLFLTVCMMPPSTLGKAERKGMSAGQKQRSLDGAIKRMQEIRATLNTALTPLHATPLGTFEEDGVVYSSQLSFYHFLLTGIWQKIRVTRTPFYEVLGTADLFFSGASGQRNTIRGTEFFRTLEIKDYSPKSVTGLLDVLLHAPCNYVLTQSYTCMAKDEGQEAIKTVEKRLSSAEDDAVSQQTDLLVARDLLQSGHIAFGLYHFSLLISAPTLEALVKDTNTLANGLTNAGIVSTLASLSLAAGYFAQMPGVYTLRPRLVPVSSQNFVEMASFHNFSEGKRDRVPWGEAVAVVKTPSGGAHYLNIHNTLLGKDDFNEKNAGNASIVGTIGSGKTMLISWLANMMQKYRQQSSFSPHAKKKRLCTVVLDKDRGTELNIRQLGGRYFRVKSGEPTGWNPFRLKPTKRNIDFIKKLMKLLCTRNGNTLSTRQETRLSDAVDAVMLGLDHASRDHGITRVLENITEPATMEAQENGLKIRLAQWAKGGEFGWVFDNEEDTFDISECDIFGIDGTEFLDDSDVCAPISFYLLYRITSLLDGRRLVLFIDEVWKWLNDPAFKKLMFNLLKTIRKLNGLVIPATQSPSDLLKSSISTAMVEQCGTQFFLPNPMAEYKDYVEGLKVPPAVFEVIKGLDPLSRQFVLIKSPLRKGDTERFAVLVTLDLSGLGKYTKILSGSEDNLAIFDSIFTEGMAPEEWRDTFLAQAI